MILLKSRRAYTFRMYDDSLFISFISIKKRSRKIKIPSQQIYKAIRDLYYIDYIIRWRLNF